MRRTRGRWWKASENETAYRLPAEKEFISDAAAHDLAINRVHDHQRLRREVGAATMVATTRHRHPLP